MTSEPWSSLPCGRDLREDSSRQGHSGCYLLSPRAGPKLTERTWAIHSGFLEHCPLCPGLRSGKVSTVGSSQQGSASIFPTCFGLRDFFFPPDRSLEAAGILQIKGVKQLPAGGWVQWEGFWYQTCYLGQAPDLTQNHLDATVLCSMMRDIFEIVRFATSAMLKYEKACELPP